jgi:hypothetical protein
VDVPVELEERRRRSPKIQGIRAETLDPDHFFAWIQEWWIPEASR